MTSAADETLRRQSPDPVAQPVVLVVVLAYQARRTITDVLDRVPEQLEGATVQILVADDASTDGTTGCAREWIRRTGRAGVEVVRRDWNLGYGGNQNSCYRSAIAGGADVVVLVHGDGQYPPERIGDLVAPILGGTADAVFGSRMLVPGAARRGGMPLWRFIGNRVLSRVQNALTGASFSEWHTGLRAYRVATLAALGLDDLPYGFEYDTAITLRLLEAGAPITEVPIATHYGDEVSYINLYDTGVRIVRLTWEHRRRMRFRRGDGPAA